MHNLLVAQSGGPTSAINATLSGVITEAMIQGGIDRIYGGLNGIEGILQEKIIDLLDYINNTMDLDKLAQTPAAALGSCRFKLAGPEEDTAQYRVLIDIFRKYEISYFIYIGGNDSMDTVDKLARYCRSQQIEDIKIIGAPKTIDNDLMEIDHCPGFASAAKYIATTFAELERDVAVYDSFGVTIVEIMGRNAGWLTAASSLSRVNGSRGPDFIYLCEVPFSISRFLDDIRSRQSENRNLLIAVSEGIRDENGTYLSEQTPGNRPDRFGHRDIAGTGGVLAQIVRNELGCKTRSLELNLMQRCAAHLASRTDLNESRLLGAKAVQCAVQGQTGKMATLLRLPSKDRYRIQFASADVSLVANREKTVPRQWINREGNGITREMTDYLTPLMEGEVPVLYRNRFPEYFTISLE